MDERMKLELERSRHNEQLKDMAALTRVLRMPQLDEGTRSTLTGLRESLQADYDRWAATLRATIGRGR